MPKRPKPVDRAWAAYSARFRAEVMPKLMSSAAFLAIYDGGDGEDARVQFATELGLMLLYDKPIILTYPPGQRPPAKLCAVADELIELDIESLAGQDAIADAFRRVMDRLGR